jgi:hypothetical protein
MNRWMKRRIERSRARCERAEVPNRKKAQQEQVETESKTTADIKAAA